MVVFELTCAPIEGFIYHYIDPDVITLCTALFSSVLHLLSKDYSGDWLAKAMHIVVSHVITRELKSERDS
jgi:hypothetical protein